ncbi:Uncharacterized protein OS=Oscillatoria nigro-viridis PCC 7112 GN=Osc7112_2999 PE=4 SV=1 [Gemmata massiliana]|uniref:Glycosyltransferase RgtA/B/C/D-like domain-containing protein n=1 Tax=Gemmata massiliana TaxID=1210884 RepID=A0A6P2CU41_9BACT|nr:hypothetical protein [Gemmata massiliana]VTR92479.1 Uncharacterized protein OS=Oscillatoria nigro-viridis PCC 7112 GN=Osc7112_2999 PE=4 SV=1 [Gemmata massiliana]
MTLLPDYLIAVFWFASTVFLGVTGWVIAGRLFPAAPVLTRAAHTIVIGWAHVVAVGLALGAVGLLLPAALLIGVTASAALALILVTRWGPRPTQTGECTIAAPLSQTSPTPHRMWLAVWSLVFAFWAGHAVTGGLLRFPTDWDTLMYHLPFVDYWLQAHSLYTPDVLRCDPGNNELIALWLVAPFSGDFLYALTNLPAAILLACASVELGSQFGLSGSWRNLAALAIVSNYVILNQLNNLENDVAVAALFLACLANGLQYADCRRPAALILAVVCLGLLAGVKYYALGYAAVAVATIAPLIALRMGFGALVRATVVGVIGCAAFGGYWYARNWIAGGSPFYPLWARVESDLGASQDIWRSTFLGNGRPELFDLAVEAVWGVTGPCHLVALLGLPVVVSWLFVSGVRRSRWTDSRGEGTARLAALAALVGAGLILLITPFAVEDVPGTLNQMHWKYCPVRYGLCFLSLAVIGLSAVLDDLSRWARRIVAAIARLLLSRPAGGVLGALAGASIPVLFAVGIVNQLVGVRKEQLPVEVLDSLLIASNVVLVVGLLRLLTVASFRPRWAALLAISVLVLGCSATVEWLSERWHHEYARFYEPRLRIEVLQRWARTEPPGTVVCVLDLRVYPFFGSARQFRVCQTHGTPDDFRWRQYLRERNVRLVVISEERIQAGWGWKIARAWCDEHGDMFEPVWESVPYIVYRVKPDTLPR